MFSSAPKQQEKKNPIEALFSFCENILGCNPPTQEKRIDFSGRPFEQTEIYTPPYIYRTEDRVKKCLEAVF